MPTIIHGSCGVGTDTSQVTATANDVLEGKIIVDANGNAISGVIPVIDAGTHTITTTGSEYTIPEGYHDGNGRVSVNISNLTAGNVRDGVTVGGVAGTFTSDATAVTNDVVSGKTFYRNGQKYTGAMSNRPMQTAAVSAVMSGGEVYLRIPDGAYMTVTSAGYPEVYMNLATLFNYTGSEPLRHCNSKITNVTTNCNFRTGNNAETVAGSINKGIWVYKTTTSATYDGNNFWFCMVPCWISKNYLT